MTKVDTLVAPHVESQKVTGVIKGVDRNAKQGVKGNCQMDTNEELVVVEERKTETRGRGVEHNDKVIMNNDNSARDDTFNAIKKEV